MLKIYLFLLIILFSSTGSYLQKINQEKLSYLLDEADKSNSDAVIIYQGDSLICETYFGNYNPDEFIETMSCTKSIIGLAVICLLDDGWIDSLQTPVYIYYPEWNSGLKKNITIEHLLNMTSGIQNNPNATIEIYPSSDFVQLALNAELTESPGEKYRYNNKALNLIPGLVEKITGKKLDVYLSERLFKPLGIEEFNWILDSAGNPHGMSGCQLRPKDFIKIGLLILNSGEYNGKQIISEKNILKLLEPSTRNPQCGLSWWLSYDKTHTELKTEIIYELIRLEVKASLILKAYRCSEIYGSSKDYQVKYGEKLMQIWWNAVDKLPSNSLKEIYETVYPENRITKTDYFGEATSYKAWGWLGNYIIIDPETKIVGIRMIRWARSKNRMDPKSKDHFYEFENLILNLTNDN